MSAQHTPGPWQVMKFSRPQPSGDYFVCRSLLIDGGSSHFEQLRGADGVLLHFDSDDAARAAIAKATSQQGGAQ